MPDLALIFRAFSAVTRQEGWSENKFTLLVLWLTKGPTMTVFISREFLTFADGGLSFVTSAEAESWLPQV
jgi:hypothetical protein